MAETFRQDGKAIDVAAPSLGCTKGDVVLSEGFHGIAMETVVSGENVAIETAQRVHEINVGGVAAAKGDVLYLTAAGAITATVGSNRKAFKVVKAKNADNYAWLLILPQV